MRKNAGREWRPQGEPEIPLSHQVAHVEVEPLAYDLQGNRSSLAESGEIPECFVHLDMLVDELRSAVGLGGRDRTARNRQDHCELRILLNRVGTALPGDPRSALFASAPGRQVAPQEIA